jgi:signal transduction histidine kinase
MTEDATNGVLLTLIIGTIALVAMASFSASFIVYYRRRRQAYQQEKAALAEAYARELLEARLESQNQALRQVGEDLHDNIGQLLVVVKMHLNRLDDDLADSPHRPSLTTALDLLRTTIHEVRQLSRTVDTEAVNRAGLHASLTLELDRIGRTGRYRTSLAVTGTPYPLAAPTETMLFRMAQESLQNAIKHARAQALSVCIGYEPTGFSLTIADDGQGFGPATAPTDTRSGSGLHNLRRRASLLGGTCRIVSQPGRGTEVQISLPHTD